MVTCQKAACSIDRKAPSVLILASASPRRAELLTAAGIPFDVRPAHVDERVHPGEDARGVRLPRRDRQGAALPSPRLPDGPCWPPTRSSSSTARFSANPSDADDAKRMLRLLSGRTHEVLTAVVVDACRGDGRSAARAHSMRRSRSTAVEFARLGKAEIDWYVATGEPMDKAGAYAIQGLASRFVTRIEGSYSNVVGLPVALVYAMCTRAGILLS